MRVRRGGGAANAGLLGTVAYAPRWGGGVCLKPSLQKAQLLKGGASVSWPKSAMVAAPRGFRMGFSWHRVSENR